MLFQPYFLDTILLSCSFATDLECLYSYFITLLEAPQTQSIRVQAGSPIGDLFDTCAECERLQALQLEMTLVRVQSIFPEG